MADVRLNALPTAPGAIDSYAAATTNQGSPATTYKTTIRTASVANTIVGRDVNGDISTRQFIGGYYFGVGGGSSQFGSPGSPHPISFYGNLTLNAGYSLTVPSLIVQSALTVNGGITSTTGNIYAQNGNLIASQDVIAYYVPSDKRYKDNVSVISNALEKIDNISGYEFTFNNNAPDHKKGKTAYGLMAQEVESILPHAIENRESDGEGGNYKGLDYDQVIGLLVQAVKELKSEVAALKAKA